VIGMRPGRFSQPPRLPGTGCICNYAAAGPTFPSAVTQEIRKETLPDPGMLLPEAVPEGVGSAMRILGRARTSQAEDARVACLVSRRLQDFFRLGKDADPDIPA
jgi:hypothetical protein